MNFSNIITVTEMTDNAESVGLSLDIVSQDLCLIVATIEESTILEQRHMDDYFLDFYNPSYDEVVEFLADYPHIALVFPTIRALTKQLQLVKA